MKTLLPGHRPELEKAIDQAVGKVFEELPVYEIDTNPKTCPEAILQVLAYSFNVDISGLEEDSARRLVEGALMMNRRKGTAYAVEKAIKAFLPESELIEHEDDPFRFSIRLEFVLGDKFDEDIYSHLLKTLEKTKNERSHLKNIECIMPTEKADITKSVGVIFTI